MQKLYDTDTANFAIEIRKHTHMIALIPGLCPFDDILLWLLAPALLVWLRKRKWCKKSCDCRCHSPHKSKLSWWR